MELSYVRPEQSDCSTDYMALLAKCITSFLVHGFLPESLMSVVLVPIIKDKSGKINSKDNYRPIAIASTMSKLLEIILLERLSKFLLTSSNQFKLKLSIVKMLASLY